MASTLKMFQNSFYKSYEMINGPYTKKNYSKQMTANKQVRQLTIKQAIKKDV